MPKSRAECLRILGLPPSASEQDIKEAYRQKARELHPDKNREDPNATERFQDLQEAYRNLVDEDDEDEIEIPYWFAMMVERERILRERERRRREFEFFQHFFQQDVGFRRGYSSRATPRGPQHYQNNWGPNVFENRRSHTQRSNTFENTGSGERKSTDRSNDGYKGECSKDWLPEQPNQPSSRSARQKKKKKGKNKKSRKNSIGGKTTTESVQGDESEGESVTGTVDSNDTDDSSEHDDNDDSSPKNEAKDSEEKKNHETEGVSTEATNTNLKTENSFSFSNKSKRESQNDEDLTWETNPDVHDDIRNDYFPKSTNYTTGNDCEKGEMANEGEKTKVKLKVQNLQSKKFSNNEKSSHSKDDENEASGFKASAGGHKTHNTTATVQGGVRQAMPKPTVKNGGEGVAKPTVKGKGGEEVPKPTVKGKDGEKVLKSTVEGKGGEKVLKSTVEGKGGEKVLKSTVEGKGGEEVLKSTVEGKGGEEVPKPTVKGRSGIEELPKYHKQDPTVKGYQNGTLHLSNKKLEFENIKKIHSTYISKYIDTTLTDRYKKLTTIAREETI